MANGKMRLAVSEMKADGASDVEIMQEVLEALNLSRRQERPAPKQKVSEKIKVSEEQMMQEISEILLKIGIPANVKGYKYARIAIMLSIKDEEMVSNVTKILYPTVAMEVGSTASRVERAIRHGIELAWERGDFNEHEKYFAYGKPINSEFIAAIADDLKLKYELS